MIAYADVRDLTAATLRSDLGYVPDVVVGSPPCQDASVAHSSGRGIDGARTGFFSEFIRLVAECRPSWACSENVPGLRTRGVDRVLADLEAEGYACWPLVVGADDIGAPHRRKRVWLVATDTERGQLREQPGWSGRPNGSGAAQPGEHVQAWPAAGLGNWQGGLPDLALLDDGLARLVAERRGLYRAICSAQGDAVLPQIPCAIGRAMRRLYPDCRTVLDLFAGAACGWSLGMTWAGYDVVALCELDDWRREVATAVHRELARNAA